MKPIFFLLLACLCTPPAEAAFHRSDLSMLTGWKFPNSAAEGDEPVSARVLSPGPGFQFTGYTELLPFVLPSPDQEEAGSCLYMSLTGIAEWWMARLHPGLSRASEGPLDFSERFLMNVAGVHEDENGIADWKTDSVFLFNLKGYTIRNRDYRFTKGWHTSDEEGYYHPSRKGAEGAVYSAAFSWINELDKAAKATRIPLPEFQREVLFADPDSDQWNTGVMPDGIVERIKRALKENKAPVQVIYNHFGYWHANFIVGYDDGRENGNCAFVTDFLAYMKARPGELRKEAGESSEPKEKERLERLAAKAEKAYLRTSAAYEKGGGCETRGVFYVRDSIYRDPKAPHYDYDPSLSGEESPYSKAIVLLEYDWVRYMANHATQISVR